VIAVPLRSRAVYLWRYGWSAATRLDFQRQYDLNPALCHFMTVSGFTIARAFRTVGADRYSQAKIKGSALLKVCLFGECPPQYVNLMPEDQDLGHQRRSRPEQPDQHRPDKAAGFLHRTERLRDSASVASPIEFTTGKGIRRSPDHTTKEYLLRIAK